MSSLETNRSPIKKGFYVRMKLLRNNRKTENNFCYRVFKFIVWFSVSLYFLSSFLITTHKPTILRTSISQYKSSHALIKQPVVNLSALKSNHGSFNGMKIYVYDLPPKFNRDWLANERCSNHLFAAEVAIHRALMSSDVRTFDPSQADFFFVPVYVSCNFSKVNGFPAIGHARSLMASAIQHISSQLPFWNRSMGSDHIFVATHDFGSCFHTMEHTAMAEGIPEFLRNSIILQTFGVKHKHPCQDVENVVIPPYVSAESVQATLEKSPLTGKRDIFAFFRGKMEVHPKNVSGRYYSKRVRTNIYRKYGNDGRFHLRRHRFGGYQSEIVRSRFCLCPLGWALWSPRLVESVALGCVPVIMADGIRLPFASAVRWEDISLSVAEEEVDKLGDILAYVAATNLTRIQRNLWDPKVRKALVFNEAMLEGDATWHVMEALSGKLEERSHRVDNQLRS